MSEIFGQSPFYDDGIPDLDIGTRESPKKEKRSRQVFNYPTHSQIDDWHYRLTGLADRFDSRDLEDMASEMYGFLRG